MLVVLVLMIFLVAASSLPTPRYSESEKDIVKSPLNNSTEYKKRFLQSRRKLEQAVHQNKHKKAWESLEEVNGLKNVEVAFFISSTVNDHERFLWER